MGDNSKIEWTDASWNVVTGCTKVSPGCDFCYAERVTNRFAGPGAFDKIVLHEDRLGLPLRWRRPRKIFVNSMSDVFHDDVSDELIARMFAVMALAEQHTFQVLTKRPGRMRSLLRSDAFRDLFDLALRDLMMTGVISQERCAAAPGLPLPNVWLGVSVEDQKWADVRIPVLLDTPAAVRFLSCEPLLGPVDLSRWLLPGEHRESLGRGVALDDEVRKDRSEYRDDVGRAVDRPITDRLPAAIGSGVVPSDLAADGRLEPGDDLRGRAVDGKPDAATVGRTSPPVDVAFAVDHPGDIAEDGRVRGDRDGLSEPRSSVTARANSRGQESAPDRFAAGAEPHGELVEGLTLGVSLGDETRGNRRVRHEDESPAIHWVIAGGESGASARPMDPEWPRRLRDVCVAAGVAFHFKQWGEWLPSDDARTRGLGGREEVFYSGHVARRVGKKLAGRELDGETWDEWPVTTVAMATA